MDYAGMSPQPAGPTAPSSSSGAPSPAAGNVRKLFSDSDPDLLEECLRKFQEDEAKEQELKAKQVAAWKHLEEIISSKTSSSELALAPQNAAAQTVMV